MWAEQTAVSKLSCPAMEQFKHPQRKRTRGAEILAARHSHPSPHRAQSHALRRGQNIPFRQGGGPFFAVVYAIPSIWREPREECESPLKLFSS